MEKERSILVGPHELRTPVFFASYRLGDFPSSGLRSFPWAMTRTEALLINAYDFTQRKYREWLDNGWNPEGYLRCGNIPILVDSGAYYFRKKSSITVTPEEILDVQLRSQADVGVVLDHPFPPDADDKAKRITTTIRNTDKMLKHLAKQNSQITVMPAIHGHTPQAIRGCIQRYRRLADKHQLPLLDHVGIGSLAPLAQRGNATLAASIIHEVRRELPESQIHCFSMGSGLLMLLAFYSGADSVDSQSWIISAAFKLAQLPGHYVVRMGKKEHNDETKFRLAMRKFRLRLKRISEMEGFAVKDWATGRLLDISDATSRREYVDGLVDLVSNEHVHNRACHNLWTYNFEVRQYRKAQKKGLLDEFMKSRLSGTRYMAAFEYAVELRKIATSKKAVDKRCRSARVPQGSRKTRSPSARVR